jgi:hypothetical protein
MGITNFSISLLQKVVKAYNPKTVIELGSQNLYTTNEDPPPFADRWYKANGFTEYACIDLAGDNNSERWDLSEPVPTFAEYDLVTDFGTSEHVVEMKSYEVTAFHGGHINSIYPKKVKDSDLGFYKCWLNKHRLLKVGGVMINENPSHGSWPGHGFHYYTPDFYLQLVRWADYKIIDIGEHPASGNNIDGWNTWCILEKNGEMFPSFEKFKTLPIFEV